MDCSTPGCPVHHQTQSLLKLMSIESVMPFNHLILYHPLLLLSSIFPSIRVFSDESVLHIRWPKFWSFSFSISPSNEYSGLISFRIDGLISLLTHWKRPWCWERLRAGGEEDEREQDGWMASLTQCTWVWASSGSWWWTGKPGGLQSRGVTKSQTWLSNWTDWTDWL